MFTKQWKMNTSLYVDPSLECEKILNKKWRCKHSYDVTNLLHDKVIYKLSKFKSIHIELFSYAIFYNNVKEMPLIKTC